MKNKLLVLTIIASGIFLTSCTKRYGCYYSLNAKTPEIYQPVEVISEEMEEAACSLEE